MTKYAASTTEIADNLRLYCAISYGECTADPSRRERLDGLARRIGLLETFVRGYERIEDSSISNDDEIINWSFTETASDLFSAIWLLATGFHKASASSLRNALEIGIVSLYFQVIVNTDPDKKVYNKIFAEWDSGVSDAP